MWLGYEHRRQPLLARRQFVRRLFLHAFVAFGILILSLAIGVAGYRATEDMSWIDALLNASMILGGMGQVNQLQTEGGKVFASFYALFSGFVLLVTAGFVIAPIAHRVLHRLHLEE